MAESTARGGAANRALWAAKRAREVTKEQGLQEVVKRGRGYMARRRQGSGPGRAALPAVPRGSAAAWPDSLVILAAPDIPQCYRYRVRQKQEMAKALDLPLFVADMRDPEEALSTIQLGSVLLIYRQPWSRIMAALVQEARRLGQPVVFETDDLVHRRDLVAANPNMATIPTDLRNAVVNGSDAYLNALRHADHVIASTEPLALDMAADVPGRAFVIENGIDEDAMAMLEGISADPPVQRWLRQHQGEIVITYGSGSRAHDVDLAVASEGIRMVMDRHPNVLLKLIGPLQVPPALQQLGDRIVRTKAAPLGDYLRDLAMSHITIAPLDPAPFNSFKSQVKYLEAGLLRLPFVASATVYENYVLDGETALIARTGQDWADHLDALVTNPELRRRLADAAFDHVQQWRLDERPGRQFAEFVSSIMSVRRAG